MDGETNVRVQSINIDLIYILLTEMEREKAVIESVRQHWHRRKNSLIGPTGKENIEQTEEKPRLYSGKYYL